MKWFFSIWISMMFSAELFAQKGAGSKRKINETYQEALSLSQEGNYLKSRQLLTNILKTDDRFYLAWFGLADLSHEEGKPGEEIENLRKGLILAGDSFPSGYKFLADALYKNGSYSDALHQMEQYSRLKTRLNPKEQLLLESCRFAELAVRNPVLFSPVNPGDSINTHADEYWPSLNAEATELVFTRLLTKDKSGQKIAKPQEDFYHSLYDSSGWRKATPLGPPVNSDENEGAQSWSADGRVLIFTACGRRDGLGSCDLYISVLRNGVWTIPLNMSEPVNSGAWESQPSLSADGETLFFVSSRAGGMGRMDLWKAEKTGISPEGIPLFGNVANIKELNTQANDFSPFIHADGVTLYFASDGRPGLGGADLFRTQRGAAGWTTPMNLGYPLNTNGNEEGLFVEVSGEKGWFSSNNNPGKGRDILCFVLPDSLRPTPVSYLRGVVVDSENETRISADIIVTNLQTNKVTSHILPTENQGDFLVCLPAGNNYGLTITQKGYLFASENLSLVNGYTKSRPKELKFRLQPIRAGACTSLKNIFFDTNSWQLTNESQTQLDEMALFMVQNPGVVMEVVGHTDRVGTEAYNMELSGKRAESVVSELKKRKIEPYRLKAKGVGYSVPIGNNNTDEGRSANRRTEFVVKTILDPP